MKSILEELYLGNIDPNTTFFKHNSAFGKAMKRVSDNEDKLLKLLDEPAKTMFSDFSCAQMEVNSLTVIEKFSIGFKLGVLFMAEVFSSKEELVYGGD